MSHQYAGNQIQIDFDKIRFNDTFFTIILFRHLEFRIRHIHEHSRDTRDVFVAGCYGAEMLRASATARRSEYRPREYMVTETYGTKSSDIFYHNHI